MNIIINIDMRFSLKQINLDWSLHIEHRHSCFFSLSRFNWTANKSLKSKNSSFCLCKRIYLSINVLFIWLASAREHAVFGCVSVSVSQHRQTGTKCLVLVVVVASFFSSRNLSNCWSQKSSIHWQFTTPLSWFFIIMIQHFFSSFFLSMCLVFPAFIHSSAVCLCCRPLDSHNSQTHLLTSLPFALYPLCLSLHRMNMCLFFPYLRRISFPVGWPFVVFFSLVYYYHY